MLGINGCSISGRGAGGGSPGIEFGRGCPERGFGRGLLSIDNCGGIGDGGVPIITIYCEDF